MVGLNAVEPATPAAAIADRCALWGPQGDVAEPTLHANPDIASIVRAECLSSCRGRRRARRRRPVINSKDRMPESPVEQR